MKIQLLSDLHLESQAFTLKVNPEANVLVLGGDITTPRTYPRFEQILRATAPVPTIYYPGNHEYYGSSLGRVPDELRTICAKFPNVTFLDNSVVTLLGVTFVGGTLWTDFALPFWHGAGNGGFKSDVLAAMHSAESGISDFTKIGGISTTWMKAQHTLCKDRIAATKVQGKPMVVCTHFLPSIQSVDLSFERSTLNPYFASDCEYLMGGNVLAWIHGHAHASCDYELRGTRVVCNPRGYTAKENPRFESQRLIEVES